MKIKEMKEMIIKEMKERFNLIIDENEIDLEFSNERYHKNDISFYYQNILISEYHHRRNSLEIFFENIEREFQNNSIDIDNEEIIMKRLNQIKKKINFRISDLIHYDEYYEDEIELYKEEMNLLNRSLRFINNFINLFYKNEDFQKSKFREIYLNDLYEIFEEDYLSILSDKFDFDFEEN